MWQKVVEDERFICSEEKPAYMCVAKSRSQVPVSSRTYVGGF
jgi:hypothetical protein